MSLNANLQDLRFSSRAFSIQILEKIIKAGLALAWVLNIQSKKRGEKSNPRSKDQWEIRQAFSNVITKNQKCERLNWEKKPMNKS